MIFASVEEEKALVDNVDFTKPVTVNKINNWCKKKHIRLDSKIDGPSE